MSHIRTMPAQSEQIEAEPIKLLRPREAAKVLGISIRTMHRWMADGAQIPCVLRGKRRRYLESRLREWAEGRQRQVV